MENENVESTAGSAEDLPESINEPTMPEAPVKMPEAPAGAPAETPAETSIETPAEAPAEEAGIPTQPQGDFASRPADAQPQAAPQPIPQAVPRYRTAPAPKPRRKRTGRAWGWLIGVTLLALAAACTAMVLGLTIRGGRGLQHSKGNLNKDGSISVLPSFKEEKEIEPPENAPKIEIHETPREEEGYTTQYIADTVSDSVVLVMAYDGTSIDYTSSGSGIVLSEDGYIITNAHVVVDATRLSVETADGSKQAAMCVGYDERTDLAVIKINAEGLHPAEFGNSDDVVVGERVIAIGNPGGFTGSVSQGIISGKNREIQIRLSNGTYATMSVLQTDAAINPGNSGGPLLNAWGQVIGINSSKIVYEGFEGIGFAIPITDAMPILDSLIAYGYVHDRAILGVSVIALDASTGPANGLPSQGLYIANMEPYSDLNNWGITAGDVILKANGKELIENEDLSDELKNFRPGDTIELEILHVYDNSVKTVQALLKDARAADNNG